VITVLIGMIGGAILYFGLIAGALLVVLVAAVLMVVPPLAVLVGIVVAAAVAFLTLWVFFLLASRFAYVPQSITVEGLGVFSSIARSASLASGNVRRFAALFIFTFLAVYSALAILYIPVGWYAWYQGVEIFEFFFNPDLIPAWYEITSQLISQASVILLSPVWMVGLCLRGRTRQARRVRLGIDGCPAVGRDPGRTAGILESAAAGACGEFGKSCREGITIGPDLA